jgi:ketosteroid isomerase-like protein
VTRSALATEIERLEALNDALQRRDRESFREAVVHVIHPDCEWEPLITGVEGAEHYRGREGMAEFFDDFLGAFEVRYIDQDFRPVGDRGVLMLTVMRVRGRESGVEVTREVGCIFEFEDGLVRRARAYESHGEARTAAEALHA